MTKRKRLGDDPLEVRKEQIREAVGIKKPKNQKAKEVKRQEVNETIEALRKDIENGRTKNYYINKEGDIIQKVTLYVEFDLLTRIKKEAIDQRKNLSDLITELIIERVKKVEK